MKSHAPRLSVIFIFIINDAEVLKVIAVEQASILIGDSSKYQFIF